MAATDVPSVRAARVEILIFTGADAIRGALPAEGSLLQE